MPKLTYRAAQSRNDQSSNKESSKSLDSGRESFTLVPGGAVPVALASSYYIITLSS
jgi:hypothetical protein